MLCTAVGVEKITGDISNQLAIPAHTQTIFVCNNCDNDRFQIFLCSLCNECVHILGTHNNCHAFLRFGNGKLCAVQTVIFLGDCIQVNVQTVGKLTNCNRYTTRAKVIAAANHTGYVSISEQTLELAFLGWVTLLYFCAAGLKRILGVLFRRTSCTAAAVTPSFTAK